MGSVSEAKDRAPVLFAAFRKQSPRRARWALLAIPAAGLFTWGLAQEVSPRPLLVLPGYRMVNEGMTPEEVRGLLGHPFDVERSHERGRECYRYGRPSFELPVFPIYALCYEDGKLQDVKVRYYNAWLVDPDQASTPRR